MENMEEGMLREPRDGALTDMHKVLGSISNQRERHRERNLCSIYDMLVYNPNTGEMEDKGSEFNTFFR